MPTRNMQEFKPMKFLKILLIVFCCAGVNSYAQTTTADSIRREMEKLDKNDPHYLDQKAGTIGTLLQHLKYSHPAQSLLLCDTLHDVFMQVKDTLRAYEAKYRYKAGIYEIRGESDSMLLMLEAYAEALSAVNKSDGYVYLDIGNVYFGFSMFGLATENYNRAEQIFLEVGNLQGLCTIYNNRAQMNMAGELNADSALMWLRKSYDVRATQLKDPILAHESMYLMAVVFRRNMQYDSAKLYLWQVISDVESGRVDQHTDHIALRQEFSGAYTAMGIVYSAEENSDSAEYYFRTGEKLYLESGYNNRLPGLYNAWSRFYIKQHDASKSWEFLKKSESYTSNENPQSLMTLYQLYADWFEWQGQPTEMYMYRMKYYRISDSLQASSNNEQTMAVASRVLQLQDKARIEEQRAAIAQRDLEAEQAERKRIKLIFITIALVVLMAGAIWVAFQLRKKNVLIEKYNRELEAANSTKEQFLSVISHDLRTPFNSLIGMSDLLRENAKSGNFTNAEKTAEQINEASRKAFILLDNLMQWVSVQKENIVVRKEWLSANEVIEEVLLLMREQSLSRNLAIEKNVVVEKINTDKTLLQVVLRNLISNAVKHTPAGGKILVSCLVRNSHLELIVDDSGHGFPQDELDGLMSKRQGISTAKKAGGLGLVLVRQFVELLGGTIKAENRKNGGARVTVAMPAEATGIVTVHDIPEVQVATSLTPQEKAVLAATLAKLSEYEFFDVSEIRAVLETPLSGETENIALWRKSLLQSVYLSDENKYAELIKTASV